MSRLGRAITAGLVLVLWLAVWVQGARAAPAAFERGMSALLDGRLDEAQHEFEAVASGPDPAWFDDGLREAARVAEMRGRYAEAQRFYRRLIEVAPDSPFVRHAQARLAHLARLVGEDAAFAELQAERERIMQQAGILEDPTSALESYESLLTRAPALPSWNQSAAWLGDQWLRAGAIERGLEWHRKAAAAAGDDRVARQRALALALIQVDRLDAAAEVVRTLPPARDVVERAALAEVERKLEYAQRLVWWRLIAWGVLTVFAVAMVSAVSMSVWRQHGRCWRGWFLAFKPDIGVIYAAPLGATFVVVSWSRQPMVASAIVWIVAGAIGILWLLAAALRLRPRAAVAVGATGLALAAALALVYVVVAKDRLVDMVLETWRYGHDAG